MMARKTNICTSLLYTILFIHSSPLHHQSLSVATAASFIGINAVSRHQKKESSHLLYFFTRKKQPAEADDNAVEIKEDIAEASAATTASPDSNDEHIDIASQQEYTMEKMKNVFPDADYEAFKLLPHRPLGCTVEETLGEGDHVFVSKVKSDSIAEKAGIQVGDVIVGVSGLFGEVQGVSGLGLDLVKGLASSRPKDEPLEIHVARGTSIFDEHEVALVDLCDQMGTVDAKTEECLYEYLSSGYDLEAPELDSENDDIPECLLDDEAECMLDNINKVWATEEYPDSLPKEEVKEEVKNETPQVKPWSSRSSPSGTFVRDPVTGKMENIDA